MFTYFFVPMLLIMFLLYTGRLPAAFGLFVASVLTVMYLVMKVNGAFNSESGW